MLTVVETPDVNAAAGLQIPFPDFAGWFRGLLDEIRPDLVVAVARGAVRLLQLQRPQQPLLGDCPVVSQHALPFFSADELRGKRVLIFDDSVVYGSTMRDAFTQLRELGAVVTCAAFTVDRDVFYGESPSRKPSPHSVLPIVARHRLPSYLIRRHHDELVQALIRFPRDYNIDFPVVAFRLRPLSSFAEIGAGLSAAPSLDGFLEVSTVVGAAAGVHRGSIFFRRPISPLAEDPGQRWRDYSKARLTWCKDVGELRVTPLAQIAISADMSPDRVRFASPILSDWWNRMIQPRRKGPSADASFFRLLNAFVSTVVGSVLAQEIRKIPELGCEATPVIDLEDIDVVLTSANSSILRSMFAHLLEVDSKDLIAQPSTMTGPVMRDATDAALRQLVEQSWQSNATLKPVQGDSPYEAVTKLLLSLKVVTDSPEKQAANSSSSRLDVGLTHEAIAELLRDECGLSYTLRDVALAIDIAIDCGQAVPKVLACSGWRMRRLYCGENSHAIDPLQFKVALHRHYKQYLNSKTIKRLTPYSFTKLCVILRDVLGDRLPISTHYRTYGRTATIGTEEIIESMTTGSAPFVISSQRGVDVLELNPGYAPWVENTWDPSMNTSLADGFDVLARVFARVSDDAVLLFSTCRTHRHTFNAVAVEAHNWIGKESPFGFERLMNALQSAHATGVPMNADAANTLFYLTSFVNEAERKRLLFSEQFEVRSTELKAAFAKQKAAGENFWHYQVVGAGLLEPAKEDEIVRKFDSLLPLLQQIRWLTAFTSAISRQLGLLSPAAIQEAFESRTPQRVYKASGWAWGMVPHVAATNYNEFFTKGAPLARSIVRTELVIPGSHNETATVLNSIAKAFLEIREAVLFFCPKYVVDEGNPFPFAPDMTTRRLPDGTTEIQLMHQFIFAMDIIKSNDANAASRLKDEFIAVLDKLEGRDVRYSITGDDRFVCSCSDPGVLWDLLHVVRTTEEMFVSADPEGCQGTRKGVFSGPVTVQRRPDGRTFIKDVNEPHRLSRAVGVMESIERADASKHLAVRRLVAVEFETAKRIADLLKIQLETLEEIAVEAKHMKGGRAVVLPCP